MATSPISIHAPARGATVSAHNIAHAEHYFNPRSRKGSDCLFHCLAHCDPISIHAPARGATLDAGSDAALTQAFQSTLPQGERHGRLQDLEECHLFQSTLPQGERQIHAVITTVPITISIHAPARGATSCVVRFLKRFVISIHAPARGATDALAQIWAAIDISIHAPARGATDFDEQPTPAQLFQSTLPQGERPYCFPRQVMSLLFQSTLPQGERRSYQRFQFAASEISIHAPARGATRGVDVVYDSYINISIHAPARGATEPLRTQILQ